jgi:hypothetical protein
MLYFVNDFIFLAIIFFMFVLVFLPGVFLMYLVRFDENFVENMLIWLENVVFVELQIFLN